MQIRFWVSAALFLIVAVTCSSQVRSWRIQEKTYKDLVRAKAGLVKLREATQNRKTALAKLKAQPVDNNENKTPEMLVYWKLDEIKERLRTDDVVVTAMEKKGDMASIPYVLKFNNHSYHEFINAIRYLQKSSSPWTPVNSISISQSTVPGKGPVIFTIAGKILANKSKP
jgi:hypothetical protein